MQRKQSFLSKPAAVIDEYSTQSDQGHEIDWSLVPESYRSGAVEIVLTANKAIGANQLAVVATKADLPKGSLLNFGGDKFARTTDFAAKGAVLVNVAPLLTAVVNGDKASFVPTNAGSKSIDGCTIFQVLNNGKVLPRKIDAGAAATSNAAKLVSKTNCVEDAPTNGRGMYGFYTGGGFYENLMSDAVGDPKEIPADYKTELGARFYFQKYGDSTYVPA